jgi:putative transposase
MADISAAKKLMYFPASSVILADRGYMNFEWFNHLDSSGVKFVIRFKCDVEMRVEANYQTNPKHPHILSDQDIRMAGITDFKNYPQTLRLVRIYDDQTEQYLILATNELSWTADTIWQLYKMKAFLSI